MVHKRIETMKQYINTPTILMGKIIILRRILDHQTRVQLLGILADLFGYFK